jgi:uncharacterized protein
MPRMVEVIIDSVRVSLTSNQRIVVLREPHTQRFLPIWIGPFEAESITVALQEIEVARPQTHDLIKNLLQSLNVRLMRIEVISMREQVYYGNLVIDTGDRIINVDSRPSDAIAIAIRNHVPILVAREVLDIAAIEPEKDINPDEHLDEPLPMDDSPVKPAPEDTETEGRLSVFEDFLENLGIGGELPDNPEDEQPPDDDDDKPPL